MKNTDQQDRKLAITYVETSILKHPPYNPRVINEETKAPVLASIKMHGLDEPLIVNSAKGRENFVLSGNLRLEVLKDLGYTEVPVVYINIPDLEQEKDLVVRLNKAVGRWDDVLLAELGEEFLIETGFSSEEIDQIIGVDENPEEFDLEKELKNLDIQKIEIKKGDTYMVGDDFRIRCGDSMCEADMLALMDGHKADMCFTDPPYLLDYLHGKKKKNGDVTKGFGLKRDRVYLGTETLPEDFSDQWMANVAKVQKPDFSIIIYENPKNLRTIWNALEKFWKYRNTIIWHLPNRVQGFSAKYKFFNKYDFAIVGTSGEVNLNTENEPEELLQNDYETALFATSGSPHWESYGKGKKYCPTDFIEYKAADKKSSGQGIIFGTKPVEILIPYIKILTKRGDLILEPFGGSGSTGAAALKMKRRCFMMEKSEVYMTVILKRIEKLTGLKARKV